MATVGIKGLTKYIIVLLQALFSYRLFITVSCSLVVKTRSSKTNTKTKTSTVKTKTETKTSSAETKTKTKASMSRPRPRPRPVSWKTSNDKNHYLYISENCKMWIIIRNIGNNTHFYCLINDWLSLSIKNNCIMHVKSNVQCCYYYCHAIQVTAASAAVHVICVT